VESEAALTPTDFYGEHIKRINCFSTDRMSLSH